MERYFTQNELEKIAMLESELASLMAKREAMKEVNAYYRRHGTLYNAPGLDYEAAKQMTRHLESKNPHHRVPYSQYLFDSNTQYVRSTRSNLTNCSRRRSERSSTKKPR